MAGGGGNYGAETQGTGPLPIGARLMFWIARAADAGGRPLAHLALLARRRAGQLLCAAPGHQRLLAANAALNQGARTDGHGRSALILGSGPSLADLPELLAGSFAGSWPVIAANETFLSLREMNLRADFHLLIDPAYFDAASPGRRALTDLAAFCRQTDAAMVLDIAAAPLIATLGEAMTGIRIHYLRQVGALARYAALNAWPPLDLTGPVPEFDSVLQAQLFLALALGCGRVALLGHDYDFLADPAAPPKYAFGTSPYFPPAPSLLAAHHLDESALFEKYSKEFNGLRHIRRMAELAGMAVENLSPHSRLDMFPPHRPPGSGR